MRSHVAASPVAAAIAFVANALALAALAALHVLSPEFDPSWRVISEYANGRYGWVLATMFVCWATGTWALAFALAPFARTVRGRIAIWLLVCAGVGQALAAAFDINAPLHDLAGLLGAGAFPAAAMLVSIAVLRTAIWSDRRAVMWLANLTWMAVVALVASLAVMFSTFVHAGGHVPSDGKPPPIGVFLPSGTIAVVGYVDRLIVVADCAWAMVVAYPLMRTVLATWRSLSMGSLRPVVERDASQKRIPSRGEML